MKTASGIRQGWVARLAARRDNGGMENARIRLVVNGEARSFAVPLDIAGLLEAEGLAGRRVAVEVNGGIVPRGQHAGFALGDGDRIEIVHALGGG